VFRWAAGEPASTHAGTACTGCGCWGSCEVDLQHYMPKGVARSWGLIKAPIAGRCFFMLVAVFGNVCAARVRGFLQVCGGGPQLPPGVHSHNPPGPCWCRPESQQPGRTPGHQAQVSCTGITPLHDATGGYWCQHTCCNRRRGASCSIPFLGPADRLLLPAHTCALMAVRWLHSSWTLWWHSGCMCWSHCCCCGSLLQLLLITATAAIVATAPTFAAYLCVCRVYVCLQGAQQVACPILQGPQGPTGCG